MQRHNKVDLANPDRTGSRGSCGNTEREVAVRARRGNEPRQISNGDRPKVGSKKKRLIGVKKKPELAREKREAGDPDEGSIPIGTVTRDREIVI